MKKLLLLLLVLPSLAVAQSITITGKITDIITNEPVDMATISAEGSNIASISNEEGNFRMTIPSDTKNLLFSHLNYKSYSLPLKGKSETIEASLETNQVVLEEVVITNKPLRDILKEVYDASKGKLEKSLVLNTYYREFAKANDHYLKFADGLLDYNIKRKSGAADLYVQQSRAKKLVDNGVKIFKKLNNDQNEDLSTINLYDVRDAVSNASNFKAVKVIMDEDKYDYELRLRKNSEGRDIEIIKFAPKPEVEEMLYEGQITYEADSKLILEIDIKMSESHKKYSKLINILILKLQLLDNAKRVIFKYENDKYILAYCQNRLKFYVVNKNKFDDTFDFMSDVVTINYKEGEFEFDRNKRYKHKDLFAAGNNFTTEYWKTSNMLLLTKEEEQILKSFE